MFTGFFYTLRRHKIPVTITEWMTLMDALSKGLAQSSLENFYYLARAILVKNEALYDAYDEAFQEYFSGFEDTLEIRNEIWEWLQIVRELFTDEEIEAMSNMSLEELMREFEKRLKEQKSRHDGGSYWIGTGGTSPFGHSGYHPAGIRVGGESRNLRALKIAGERRFRNLRRDVTLDVRQMEIALKSLRILSRIGPADELDLEGTIDATAKNAGELELKWRRSRRNVVKLLLLMDVGGSMDPYAGLCSRLFTAAHSATHFKDFKYYYFHNCIYDKLYTDMERQEWVNTKLVLKTLDSDYKTIIVGDAMMATSELLSPYGAINISDYNETPGIVWLKMVAEHFPYSIWLNPVEPYFWDHTTVSMIRRIFPMYHLTIDGLTEGIRRLVAKR
ncbi:MAG: VWA domain-containing protein [Thaumarchaeota archaeon]|nr:VWA domain-containing protein [Nitrososphaerota archaeon]